MKQTSRKNNEKGYEISKLVSKSMTVESDLSNCLSKGALQEILDTEESISELSDDIILLCQQRIIFRKVTMS